MFADDFASVFVTDKPNSNQEDAEEADSQINSICLGLRALVNSHSIKGDVQFSAPNQRCLETRGLIWRLLVLY
jgi:hypothetical protein